MDKVKYYVTGKRAEDILVQWLTSIMIGGHIGIGVAIMVAGADRFIATQYQPLIDIVGGHMRLWGVWAVVAGMLMMVPYKWPNAIGIWIGMSWFGMWMSLFAFSVAENGDAAPTPMIAYGMLAVIDAALLTVRVMDKNEG